MGEERLFSLKRTGIIVLAAGLFVFLLYLYFFVDYREFSIAIQQIDLVYYTLAFGAMLGSVAFYSLTWQRLLHLLSVKSSFLRVFQFTWVGDFVNLLVPAESISGDISRIYLMSKESGENAGRVVASVIGHRVLSMVITLGGLVTSSVYLLIVFNPPILVLEFISIIAAGSVVSLILIFYLSGRRKVTVKIIDWVLGVLVRLSRGRWKFEGLKKAAEKMLKAFYDGIDTLAGQRKHLIFPLSLGIVAWLLDLLISVFVFHALNAPISFSKIAIVYSISIAIQTIPLGVPGEVGILDVAMATLYYALGVPIAVSAAATLLIRILTLWLRLIIGGVTTQWLGIKGLKPSASSPN